MKMLKIKHNNELAGWPEDNWREPSNRCAFVIKCDGKYQSFPRKLFCIYNIFLVCVVWKNGWTEWPSTKEHRQ